MYDLLGQPFSSFAWTKHLRIHPTGKHRMLWSCRWVRETPKEFESWENKKNFSMSEEVRIKDQRMISRLLYSYHQEMFYLENKIQMGSVHNPWLT